MSWDHVPTLDEEVIVAHQQDRDALRAIIAALEAARMDGVYNPPVARELNRVRAERLLSYLVDLPPKRRRVAWAVAREDASHVT
jgi:hypothetical protein